MTFPSKLFIAIISLLIAFPAWILLGKVLEVIKILDFLPRPYSSYVFISSFGLLSVLFYAILMRLKIKKEKPQGTMPISFSARLFKVVVAVISVFFAAMSWIGIIFIMDNLKVPISILFLFSQFSVGGWILFGLLTIAFYILFIKIMRSLVSAKN